LLITHPQTEAGLVLSIFHKLIDQQIYNQLLSIDTLRRVNVVAVIRISKKHDRILSLYSIKTSFYPDAFNSNKSCQMLVHFLKDEIMNYQQRVKQAYAKLSCNSD
jgi:SPX domain protein involved in polyphosphate accumulation